MAKTGGLEKPQSEPVARGNVAAIRAAMEGKTDEPTAVSVRSRSGAAAPKAVVKGKRGSRGKELETKIRALRMSGLNEETGRAGNGVNGSPLKHASAISRARSQPNAAKNKNFAPSPKKAADAKRAGLNRSSQASDCQADSKQTVRAAAEPASDPPHSVSRERSKSQEIDPPNVGDPHREEEVPSRPRSDSLSFEEGKRKESKARRKASRKNTLPDETSDSRKRTESQRKKSSGSKGKKANKESGWVKGTKKTRRNTVGDTSDKTEEPHPKVDEDPDLKAAKQRLLMAVLSNDYKQVHECLQDVKVKTAGEINYREGKDRTTVLHRCAIQGGHHEVISLLMRQGADAEVEDANGTTPLHIACQRCDVEAARALLENGAHFNHAGPEGRLPIHFAARGGHAILVELLVGFAADVDERDNHGWTALHYAARSEKRECARFLVDCGADCNAQDEDGKLPWEVVQVLADVPPAKDIQEMMKMLRKRAEKQKKEGEKKRFKTKMEATQQLAQKRMRTVASGSSAVMAKSATEAMRASKAQADAVSRGQDMPALEDVRRREAEARKARKGNVTFTPLAPPPSTSQYEALEVNEEKLEMRTKLDAHGFIRNNEGNRTAEEEEKAAIKYRKAEEVQLQKWIKLIPKWDEVNRKHQWKIRREMDKGVPGQVRGEIWKRIMKLDQLRTETKIKYETLDKDQVDEKTRHQIEIDLDRTMPNHFLFKEGELGKDALRNVLQAHCVYDPHTNYCQGMGFVVATALMYLTEEDAFWFLVRLTTDYMLSNLWKDDFQLLKQVNYIVEKLLEREVPKVHAHFKESGFDVAIFTPHMFLTLFTSHLSFPLSLRIMDCLVWRGFDFLYSVAISFFKIWENVIVKWEFENIMYFCQFNEAKASQNDWKIPQFDRDEVINTAIGFKVKPTLIRKLELEFEANNQRGFSAIHTTPWIGLGLQQKDASKIYAAGFDDGSVTAEEDNKDESFLTKVRRRAGSKVHGGVASKSGKQSSKGQSSDTNRGDNESDGSPRKGKH